MKIRVMGAGSAGSRHIRNLIALGVPAEDIEAVDVRQEALDALPDGVRRTWPGTLTAASEVDTRPLTAVLVCTPAAEHARALRIALAGGSLSGPVPFFVEKPATVRVADLADAEWSTDVLNLVGYNLRFHPWVQEQASDSRTRALSARFWLRTQMASWPGQGYAAPLLECSHEIDLALHLLGDGKLMGADRRLEFGSHQPTYEQWELDIEHARTAVQFSGIRSSVSIESQAATHTRRWSLEMDRYGGWTHCDPTKESIEQTYVAEMAHFLRLVRGHEPSRCTLPEARRVLQICEEAARS